MPQPTAGGNVWRGGRNVGSALQDEVWLVLPFLLGELLRERSSIEETRDRDRNTFESGARLGLVAVNVQGRTCGALERPLDIRSEPFVPDA